MISKVVRFRSLGGANSKACAIFGRSQSDTAVSKVNTSLMNLAC